MLKKILRYLGHVFITAFAVLSLLFGSVYLYAAGETGPNGEYPNYTYIFSKMFFGGSGYSMDEAISQAENNKNIFPLHGNVGIGTTEPEYNMDFAGETPAILLHDTITKEDSPYPAHFLLSAGNDFARIISQDSVAVFLDSNNDEDDQNFVIVNNEREFSPSSNELFRVQENGNVGIGTKTPREKLEVNGILRVGNTQIHDNEINRYNNDNLYIGYKNTKNTILQANGGRVGVGLTNPGYTVDVNGYVNGRSGLCIRQSCRTSWPSAGGWLPGMHCGIWMNIGPSGADQMVPCLGYNPRYRKCPAGFLPVFGDYDWKVDRYWASCIKT